MVTVVMVIQLDADTPYKAALEAHRFTAYGQSTVYNIFDKDDFNPVEIIEEKLGQQSTIIDLDYSEEFNTLKLF